MPRKLPNANFFDILLVFLGRRERYLIKGDSMTPLLTEGEEVVVKITKKVKCGDIAIASHPFKSSIEIVKRVESIDEAGNCFLISENPVDSRDSRSFGAVPIECIKGKVVSRLK